MDIKERLKLLEEMEQKVYFPTTKEGVEKQHAKGKLTARERVSMLFDTGTFVETNMYAQHQCTDFGMERNKPFGDGMITGFGKVDDKVVYVYATDATVYGGSFGHTTMEKMCRVIFEAREAKAPLVCLWDGGGARIQEGSSYGFDLYFAQNIKASGMIPQIAAIMGDSTGGAVYSPALCDFIIMVEGTSSMFITGPRVIKEVMGEEISKEDLGGAKIHSEISGVCDLVAKDEPECFQMIKRLLSFLPSNHLEKPPVVDTGDDPNPCDEGLLEIVPDNPRAVFDMNKLISKIVDNGDFFEIKGGFARNIITGFARLGGFPVGIVANQPMVLAGVLDCDASDKAARFYRTCDCFNIPIVTFVDVPGYLPGVQEERKGIIRHGAKMLYAYVEATVPKITVTIRKAYGGSYTAMGTKTMGADYTLAWPTAEIALMGAEAAIEILYAKDIAAAADKEAMRSQKLKEYREKYGTPYYGASRMIADTVIKPQETRPHLIRCLKLMQHKRKEFPTKRHGNIPL